ncbi:glycosyltransferase [bacterium]|nr:glycosyltransferase [bacterium]
MTAPRISAVMPVYRTPPDFVRRAIASLLAQTLPPVEVFVIEDGWQPGLAALVREFADPRLRLIRLPQNVGPLWARRAGIECSAGEYIALQDADDESLPARFEKQAAWLAKRPRCAIVSCNLDHTRGTTNRGRVLTRANELHGGPCLFRREAYEQAGGVDGILAWCPDAANLYLAEDYALWLSILAHGWECARLPEILYRRGRHANSATAKFARECDAAGARLRELIAAKLKAERRPRPRVSLAGGVIHAA